ncbi:MAG: radical SAM protein [Lachnospiraceae bacterium]|nr:radical SAM protein [Lachnospiraceae bacterium]
MIKVGSEREIAFSRKLRYERQNNYDIGQYEYTNFSFPQCGDKRIYKNFNFSIFLDDYCNADCRFCVAQLRYSHRQAMYIKPHIQDEAEYFRRLDKVLSLIRPLNPSVSITGGEPSLSPKLPLVIKMIDDYGFRKRTITTNGSGLLKKVKGNERIIEQLIRYNFDHLNISRASEKDELNLRIMRYHKDEEYCDNQMLKQIIDITNSSPLNHRLSCLLLKESVNSVDRLKEYLEFYRQMGVNNVIFRELMDFSGDAVNTEKIRYCLDNKIRLNDIWEAMEKDSDFVPYLNILGYYYYVEIYKYHEMTVASESADLNQQYVEKDKNKDMVYEMIFHPNGNLCGSWVDSEEILDGYR